LIEDIRRIIINNIANNLHTVKSDNRMMQLPILHR